MLHRQALINPLGLRSNSPMIGGLQEQIFPACSKTNTWNHDAEHHNNLKLEQPTIYQVLKSFNFANTLAVGYICALDNPDTLVGVKLVTHKRATRRFGILLCLRYNIQSCSLEHHKSRSHAPE